MNLNYSKIEVVPVSLSRHLALSCQNDSLSFFKDAHLHRLERNRIDCETRSFFALVVNVNPVKKRPMGDFCLVT